MRLAALLPERVIENPMPWLLLGALLITGYGNYRTGHRLTTVCEDIQDMTREAPFNAPRSAMAAWQKQEAEEIESICGERLADPADD